MVSGSKQAGVSISRQTCAITGGPVGGTPCLQFTSDLSSRSPFRDFVQQAKAGSFYRVPTGFFGKEVVAPCDLMMLL